MLLYLKEPSKNILFFRCSYDASRFCCIEIASLFTATPTQLQTKMQPTLTHTHKSCSHTCSVLYITKILFEFIFSVFFRLFSDQEWKRKGSRWAQCILFIFFWPRQLQH